MVDLDKTEMETTSSILAIELDAKASISGFSRTSYQNLHGIDFRNTYNNATDETVQSKLLERYPSLEISDIKITNKEDINLPIVENFKFSGSNAGDVIGDKIYFKPLFFKGVSKNPFKLEKREFPIDYGSANSYTYRIAITIPDGYVVESLPEAAVLALGNNMATYKFQVSAAGAKTINVYASLQINSAVLPAENYNEIKNFYKGIVNKNLEQVVLTKKVL